MSWQRPSRTHSCPYSFRLRVYAIRLLPTWRTASSNAHYFWISHFDTSRSAPKISLRWLVLAFLNITGMRSNRNRKCLCGLAALRSWLWQLTLSFRFASFGSYLSKQSVQQRLQSATCSASPPHDQNLPSHLRVRQG